MRCFNGCPDDKLKAYLDEQTRLHKEIEALGVLPTYFPMEEMYMGFDKNYRAVTEFHPSLAHLLRALTTSPLSLNPTRPSRRRKL